MDEPKTLIKCKIVKLEDFSKNIASVFKDQAGFTRIHFLFPDTKANSFLTAYSSDNTSLSIAKCDLNFFGEYLTHEIFYPRKVLRYWGLLRLPLNIKVVLKIYFYGIKVIMPIQSDNGLSCLILFCDHEADVWFKDNIKCAKEMAQNISFCLEAIKLYNQTLEGVIRKYERPKKNPVRRAFPADDEHIPALIERKVEFL